MESINHMHPDARRQAILERLTKVAPEIKCPSGSIIVELCTNPICKNSLKCNNEKCPNCGSKIHEECTTVSLQKLTKLVNKKSQLWKQQITDIFMIEEELIEKIRRQQQHFLDMFVEAKMSEEKIDGIKRIYGDKKYYALSGEQASFMCNQLQKGAKINEQDVANSIKLYRNQLEKEGQQIFKIRVQCFLNGIKYQQFPYAKITEQKVETIPFKKVQIAPVYHTLTETVFPPQHKAYQKLQKYLVDKYVVKIDLGDCVLGDRGCQLISTIEWPYLRELILRSNYISAEGCRYLLQANWPNLTTLYLSYNDIEERARSDLKKQLRKKWPGIQIQWQFGKWE